MQSPTWITQRRARLGLCNLSTFPPSHSFHPQNLETPPCPTNFSSPYHQQVHLEPTSARVYTNTHAHTNTNTLQTCNMAGATTRWWSKETVAVVTGANKGIGLEFTRQLARNGLTTVLTARDEGRGQAAAAALRREGLEVAFHALDVHSDESARALASWVRRTYGGLDVLVNNAGVAKRDVTVENVHLVMQTNYFGVKRVTEALLPVMRRDSTHGSRIVIVASRAGLLKALRNKHREELADRANLTEAKLDEFVKAYTEDVRSGTWEGGGWAERGTTYNASKVAVNGYVTVLHRALHHGNGGIAVNSFCPGVTKTDMTEGKGSEDVAGAVQTGLWLALHPPGGPSGKFWAEGQEMGWD